MQQVGPNTWVEIGFVGCNVGCVASQRGLALVDSPQRPSDGVRWRQMVLAHGTPRYLLHTEHHADHITSDFLFPEAPIVAHTLVQRALLALPPDAIRRRIAMLDPDWLPLLENHRPVPPAITFNGELTLYLGDQEVRLLQLPGHTEGQTAVYLPQERVVFTGDNIFCNEPSALQEAVPYGWLDSLERLRALDVDVYVPGHGPVCGKEYLSEQARVIKEWLHAVQEAVDRKWTLEEAKERIPFRDPYALPPGSQPKVLEQRREELRLETVERLYGVLSRPTER